MAKNSRLTAWIIMKHLVIPCMFLCAIFKHPVFQWIACIALAVWALVPAVSFIRSRPKRTKKKAAAMEKPKVEAADEGESGDAKLNLLRQVNYRITEQMKQTYPVVSWLWETRPTTDEITSGFTRRIKLNNCDPFNFGEVSMAPAGKLTINLLQLIPLSDASSASVNELDLEEEDILDRSDVKQWYTSAGEKILCDLIDELNVQGHKRLVIHENGDVFVISGDKEETVDTIPNFPPKPAWDDLCVLAREDEIKAEVRGQELAVSWA